MQNIMKKVISLTLVITLILSLICVPGFAATVSEGTNGKNIYLSLVFTSDTAGETSITSVDKDDVFYIWLNFAGNPTNSLKESVNGYDLLVGYNTEKIEITSKTNRLTAPTLYNNYTTEGVVYASWVTTEGIVDDEGELASSGTLIRLKAKALTNLSNDDLNNIKFLKEANIAAGNTSLSSFVVDGATEGELGKFTIIQTPAIAVGAVEGKIYSYATAADVKAKISSFSFIDVSGASTTYTKNDVEWADFVVSLPVGGLVVGDNTLTASYGGCTCEFEVEVFEDKIESIAVTTAPTKTTYTAFDKFDKAGMAVTATYESGATKDVTSECVVDTTTELKVADNSWTVTYSGKTAEVDITVLPLGIDVPVVSSEILTYTGAVQNFEYSPMIEEYVSVTGETSGKDAKTYNATAALKDKNNTVWKNGTGTADVELSWTIGKTAITSGLAAMTKKYTTTYAELPTVANLIGVNSESVSATISWYTDVACEIAANSESQIADSYTGNNQTTTLYYKATGMANYEDYKGSVFVSVEDKDVGEISWKILPSGLSKDGENIVGTYDNAGYTILASMFEVKAKGGESLGEPDSVLINGSAVNTITDVGTYTVTVNYEDKDNKAIEEFTVVVNRKSIEGFKVSLKVGEEDAVETSSTNPLLVTYAGSEITPEVAGVEGVAVGNYSVDGEAQSAKDVSDTAYRIAVIGTGNYTGTAYGYWNITPAEIVVSAATVADKQYNKETEDANITNVTFDGLKGEDALEKGVDYEIVSAVYTDKNAGENVIVNVTVALKDTVKNYTLKTATVATSGKITQAAAPELLASAVQTLLSSSVVAGAKDYSFNLTSVIPGIPADAGDVTFAVKTEGGFVKKIDSGIDGSALKVNVAQPQEAPVTDSVVITVSSTNYADADVTINFEFKDKTDVSGEIILNDVSAIYGNAYTVAGSYANQPGSGYTWTYEYVGIDGTVYPASDIAPVNAGKYSVTAYYEDNTPDSENPEIPGHIGEKTATITISKKSLTITDGDVAVTKAYDETTDAGTLTGNLALSGIVGEDEVYIDMSSATVSAYSAAGVGTYTVEIGALVLAGADKENYSIPETYSFSKAKITKQLQSAVTINGSNENISAIYGDEIELVLGGGNGEGAYTLTSSDNSILKLNAKNDNTWEAEILKAGTVTLVASKLGDNNYEAATNLEISFEIEPKTIGEGDFTIDLADKVFTGSEIKPDVTSETLAAATDYDVAYSGNVNAGSSATITITGKDNFQGVVSKTFTITPKAFDETEFIISGLAEGYTYTGAEIKPLVSVAWGNIVLVAGTDFDFVYENNTNAGTATVTLTGKGNYSGALAETYTINPAAYTGSVTIAANEEPVTENTILTANTPVGGELAYQWKRNDVNIENATTSTYTVTAEDIDAEISVVVTSSGNYVGSVESAAVVVGKSVLTGTVTISGTTELVANVAEAPSEDNYTIVWLRDGNVIAGATGTTYTVTPADKGCDISVKLVASGDSYTGEVLSSNSVLVPAEAPSFESNPSVSVGNGSITVSFGAKANGAEITNYQIMVNGSVVATVDGNQTSYTVSGLVNGTPYTINVVAINGVGETVSAEVTATPVAPSIGGGGSAVSSNKVAVSTTTGGKITTNLKNAYAGSKVVINVTPDEGYKLSEVIVRDKNGNVIEVTIDGLSATFKMPKTAVTIEPVFVKDDATEDKPDDKPDVEPGTTEFNDVKSSAYYYDAVNWAIEKGITSGTGEDTFSPDGECSRAQIVTFLWRAAGSPKTEDYNNPFADINKDDYYYDAVMWAVKNGMTLGISETAFAPGNQVTRAQSVTFLWRFAGLPETEADDSFADVADGDYYSNAVAWAASENVTKGLTETSFGPEDVCVRAQIVTFIYRYFVK